MSWRRVAVALAPLGEFVALCLGFGVLTAVLTYPLGLHPSAYARLDADGRFSIWNVAWVAHALLTNPTQLWNANIFFPAFGTLAYSEANIAAGVLATPVYFLTGNPYAAHNSVLLLSFVLSALGMYYLVRHLAGDRRAAIISAICFSFCPYVFAHLSHIQLLMTAGLPFSLLAFHRISERPTLGRGAALGCVMAAQAYACAYYGIFAMLLVGFSTILMASLKRFWTNGPFWRAIGAAALIAILLVIPLGLPYVTLVRAGFERTLAEADFYSLRGRSYFASAAYAHVWMLDVIGTWREVLFPGFVPLVFGLLGVKAALDCGGLWRKRVWLYIGFGVLAIWMSLGPKAGLYSVAYWTVPGFTLLRAPSRFGMLLLLALSVLAGLSMSTLLARLTRRRAWTLALVLLAVEIGESVTPVRVWPVTPLKSVYDTLAAEPAGAVIELPLYSRKFAFLRTNYMLASTLHWKPLVGGYSDYIPDDFASTARVLGDFPSHDAFTLLGPGVRYAVFHLDQYDAESRSQLLRRLAEFSPKLTGLAADDQTWLFRIDSATPNL